MTFEMHMYSLFELDSRTSSPLRYDRSFVRSFYAVAALATHACVLPVLRGRFKIFAGCIV